jgi:hypothetical protein
MPTGAVTFQNGDTVFGTANVDSTGTATYTIPWLDPGDYTLTASYGGDSTYPAATATFTFTMD